jgi:hypothetical protein
MEEKEIPGFFEWMAQRGVTKFEWILIGAVILFYTFRKDIGIK